jgi:hypothetical protein
VNKILIKVIKRKDARVPATVATQSPCEQKLAVTACKEKIERGLHDKMVDTVSNWISERRENNRIEEITAIRQMSGNETLLNRS